jgi:iron(III) transport system permease protein
LTLHNIVFVFADCIRPAGAEEHRDSGRRDRFIGTMLALVIAYITTRRVAPGSRALKLSPRRFLFRIVLGVGLFLSYTGPPFVLRRCGSC